MSMISSKTQILRIGTFFLQAVQRSGKAFLVCGLFGFGSFADAADWNGGEGNWSSWSAWSNSSTTNASINSGPFTLDTPVVAQNVFVNNSTTLNIQNNLTARFLSLANSPQPTVNIGSGTLDLSFCHVSAGASLTQSPTLNISGGTITINAQKEGRQDSLVVGYNSTNCGKMTMSGGSLTVAANTFFALGLNTGSSGSVAFSGGSIDVKTTLSIGEVGTGVFTMTQPEGVSTTLSAANLNLGKQADAKGTFTLSGGTLTTTASLVVGNMGIGTMTVSGGTLGAETGTSNIAVGGGLGGVGTLDISAGKVYAPNVYIASPGSGTLAVSGSGELNASGSMFIGNVGRAEFTISGGKMTASEFIYFANGSTSSVSAVISGGTVSATKDVVFSNQTGSVTQFKMTNGTIQGKNLFLCEQGTGTFKMSGGTLDATTELIVGRRSGSDAVLEISGGTVNPCQVIVGSEGNSKGVLTLSGGTMNLTGKNIYVGNSGTGTLNLSGNGTLSAANLVLLNHVGAASTVNVLGGGSTTTIGTLKSADTSAESTAVLNFVLNNSGLSTLNVGTLTLSNRNTISIDAAIRGFYVTSDDTFTLIDVSGSTSCNASFVSKSPIFAVPTVSGSDAAVTLNATAQSSAGAEGFFQISSLTGGDIEQLFITTTLTGADDLTNFAQWLSNETGTATSVENGGVYIWKNMSATENFLWDFTAYTDAGIPVLMTRAGVDSEFAATPEPASWILLMFGAAGIFVWRNRCGKENRTFNVR